MFGNPLRSLAGIILMLPLISLAANSTTQADDAKNIDITSKGFEYNHNTGIAIYTGAVHAQQGSRHLWGDKLEIFRAENGQIDKIIVLGHPARHESLTAPEKPKLTAWADEMIYFVSQKKLTLKDHAHVEQGGDIYEAPYIEYDLTQETVRSPQTDQGQTTITLKPRARS